MPVARPPRQSGSDNATPGRLPDVTPQQIQPAPDYGLHTLQAVIEMQKSLGMLTAKVDRLVDDVSSQGDKIDGLRTKLVWMTGAGAAVGALIGALIAVLNAVPWDRLLPPST